MVDFDFITPRLATGARLSSVEDAEILVEAGITGIIDCTWLEPDQQYTDTQVFAAHPALSVLWNPTIDDGETKGVDWFEPSIDFAFQTLSKPRSALYCHCDQGRNRGPSTAFAVMLALGWTYDTAIEMIHTARPATIGWLRYANDAANALREMGYLR